jgi:hypothetical protein
VRLRKAQLSLITCVRGAGVRLPSNPLDSRFISGQTKRLEFLQFLIIGQGSTRKCERLCRPSVEQKGAAALEPRNEPWNMANSAQSFDFAQESTNMFESQVEANEIAEIQWSDFLQDIMVFAKSSLRPDLLHKQHHKSSTPHTIHNASNKNPPLF